MFSIFLNKLPQLWKSMPSKCAIFFFSPISHSVISSHPPPVTISNFSFQFVTDFNQQTWLKRCNKWSIDSQKLPTNSNDPFASVTHRSIINPQIVSIGSFRKRSMPVRWIVTNRNMWIVSRFAFVKATKNVSIAKISIWALPPPWAVRCCCWYSEQHCRWPLCQGPWYCCCFFSPPSCGSVPYWCYCWPYVWNGLFGISRRALHCAWR